MRKAKSIRERAHAVTQELRRRDTQATGDPVSEENPGDHLRAREAETESLIDPGPSTLPRFVKGQDVMVRPPWAGTGNLAQAVEGRIYECKWDTWCPWGQTTGELQGWVYVVKLRPGTSEQHEYKVPENRIELPITSRSAQEDSEAPTEVSTVDYTHSEADAIRAGLPHDMLMTLKASPEWAKLLEIEQVVDVEAGVATFRRGTVIWVNVADGEDVLKTADALPEFIVVAGVAWPTLIQLADAEEVDADGDAFARDPEPESTRLFVAERWAKAIRHRKLAEHNLARSVDYPLRDSSLGLAEVLLQAIRLEKKSLDAVNARIDV